MGLKDTVKTALTVAQATGGIYTLEDTGRSGINRTRVPAAFGDAGIIKPCILIKERATFDTADLVGNITSARTTLEVWFYDHDSYLVIDAMRESVYGQLQNARLDGTFELIWNWDVREGHDESIDACTERSDFWVYLVKGS